MDVKFNRQFDVAPDGHASEYAIGDTLVLVTPPLDENYWQWRVRLTSQQALVAFPKFNTFGIGFQVEDDWNTNLPYSQTAEVIYAHIRHNKGDEAISDEACLDAIRALQAAVRAYRGETDLPAP